MMAQPPLILTLPGLILALWTLIQHWQLEPAQRTAQAPIDSESNCDLQLLHRPIRRNCQCHCHHYSACLDQADTPTESVTGQGTGLADGPADSDSETNPSAADLGLADIDPADTVTGPDAGAADAGSTDTDPAGTGHAYTGPTGSDPTDIDTVGNPADSADAGRAHTGPADTRPLARR